MAAGPRSGEALDWCRRAKFVRSLAPCSCSACLPAVTGEQSIRRRGKPRRGGAVPRRRRRMRKRARRFRIHVWSRHGWPSSLAKANARAAPDEEDGETLLRFA